MQDYAFSGLYQSSGMKILRTSKFIARGEVTRMTPDQANSAAPGETRFAEMVFPEQANHYGTLFGGNALSMMGNAAFVAATRRARCPVVMASSDAIAFHVPVRVGELAELTARVVRIGRSSMTVAVDLVSEALISGHRELAASGSFEMVAVDEAGRPAPIADAPSLHPREEILS
jgi:acyl-CoA hydrolase